MPFYQKGDVRIRYEEAGSGFPLLVTPGVVRCRFAGAERRDHGLSLEGAGGVEGTHDRPGASLPTSAHPNARCRAIGELLLNVLYVCRRASF
jgi:hypothetical protein